MFEFAKSTIAVASHKSKVYRAADLSAAEAHFAAQIEAVKSNPRFDDATKQQMVANYEASLALARRG